MLTESRIKGLNSKSKPYKVGDGEGLFLRVTSAGKKCWRYQYNIAGKPKSLSFGAYPYVTLLAAREKRREAQELLRKNIDPSLRRQSEKRQLIKKYANTFEAVARLWLDSSRVRWSHSHSLKTWRRLEIHMFPLLANVPLQDIKPLDILITLQRVERSSTDNAHRLLRSCNGIFGYARVMGLVDYNPAVDIGKLLLPNVEGHFPVIEVREIPEFLLSFKNTDARKQDKLAFELLLLTALRTAELRYSKWSDINARTREIRVRKEIMKMKRDHIVPLSRQAVDVLRELYSLTGHQEWLFPNPVPRKQPVMSENVINIVIADMGYKNRIVGHSFRKLFSTVLNEMGCHEGAIERQLAHTDRNKVRGIYNHAEYIDVRHKLMQQWADYLDQALVLAKTPSSENFEHNELFLLDSSSRPAYLTLSA